ncbi:MAG: PKD domain-containing protein [Flavobacteriales bacterium]|nr:PKD domain-containing protein [Flavobacteriales bacterium]
MFHPRILYWVFLVQTIWLLPHLGLAQQGCTNADFGTGNFTGWVGRTGSCCGINTPNTGIVNGRHTIMTGNATDPIACDDISVVAPGYANSARLGNSGSGCEAERLSYTYNVTQQSALFIFQYAVVLEDPGHSVADQPRFEIRVLNAAGQVISPQCGFYQVTAAANISGFRSCGGVRYRAWTPVGIDLSGFIGQNITIEFTTGDCGLCGHFGYAYIVAECNPLEISVDYCPANSNDAVLTAPIGFDYQWSNGQTTREITVPNPTSGVQYSCTLTAVTGCVVTLNATINATTVNTDFSHPAACPGDDIPFTDNTTTNIGNIVSWDWNFGDGTVSNLQNPSHIYPQSGLYNVSLTTTTDNGCYASHTTTVDVNPIPMTNFSAPEVCDQNATQFINTTLFPPTIGSWSWDFGDGTASDNVNWSSSHTYSAPGTYDATLTAYSQNGVCTSSITNQVVVAPLPIPDFSYANVCFGDPVIFQNTSVGNVTNVNWNFGDNTPPIYTLAANHYYISPGTYDVQLTVTNQNGCSDSITQVAVVSPSPQSFFDFENVCFGDPVVLENNSILPPNGNIQNWEWDFGDGSPINSNTWAPQHDYQSDGVFDITLITYSPNLMCSDTLVDSVRVYSTPIPNFTFENVCFGEATPFISTSTGEISSWKWEFGDGTSPNLNQAVNHVYAAAGTYTVRLSVTTIYGCDAFIEQQVSVYPSPSPSFIASEVCHLDSTSFFSTSTVDNPSTIATYNWNFGDLSPAGSGQSTYYTYPNAGVINVKHTVTTSEGCIDSVSQAVTVNPNPIVQFAVDVSEGCSPLCVQLQELAGIESGYNQSWIWDFGDGDGSPEQNPQHCFENNRTDITKPFDVRLTVTSDKGCVSERVNNAFVRVYPTPRAGFESNPYRTTILFPTIKFRDESQGANYWAWDFGDNQVINTSGLQNPNYEYLATGTYTVTQIVYNDFECSDTTEGVITVTPSFTIYIPSAFTPNNDFINDRFYVKGVGIVEFKMWIYNRWGDEIHYSEDINEGWGADTRNNERLVENDTYVYVVEVIDINGAYHRYTDRVQVLR